MGTKLTRAEFRQIYPAVPQGLFVFENERRIPKDVPITNLGQRVSDSLSAITPAQRRLQIGHCLQKILAPYAAVHLTRIEVLFAPTLGINAVGALLALCRNRKILLQWPGEIRDGNLIYGEPSTPEYRVTNYASLIDTYIITE